MEIALKHADKVALWGEAAVPVLEKVASEYGGYIYYKEFAEKLFEATGATTAVQLQNWIGTPLGKVVEHCIENRLPALSALVVHAVDGKVGRGFNAFLEGTGRARIEDSLELEKVAAEERLKCYRLYSDHVPADAEPRLTRQHQRAMERSTPQPPPPSCGGCGTQLPASGQCDYCN